MLKKRTVQVSLAIERQTPACMLRQRMKHMIQKPNSRIYSNSLALGGLGSVALGAAEELRVCVSGEFAAVKVDG
jgi:hypothetical protein